MKHKEALIKILKTLGKILAVYLVYVVVTAIIWPVLMPAPEHVDVEPAFVETSEEVALLEYGIEAFGARLDLIDSAEETIDVAYYYAKKGKSVDLFHAYMLAAADRGVKVRYLLDGISHGVRGDERDVIYAFNDHPNIEFKLHEPIPSVLLAPWRINNRMHDKLLLVDNKYSVNGGRNISDLYYERTSQDVAYSHDRDIFLMKTQTEETGIIDQLSAYYGDLFDSEYAVDLDARSFFDWSGEKARLKTAELKQVYADHRKEVKERGALTSLETWTSRTMPIESGYHVHNELTRGFKQPYVWSHLLELSSRADSHLFIQSPWVIPNSRMREEFRETDFKTSEGLMLTNGMSTNNNPIGQLGTENRKSLFIDSFLDYYEYQPTESSLHTKTWVFDKEVSAIGSYNFDARSTYLSTESMVILKSEALAEQLLTEAEESFIEKSRQIHADGSSSNGEETNGKTASLAQRLLTPLLRPLAWLLEDLI
ncbi:phospholipase D family protein [Alkalibacterium putridalgicola]|uniref:phospholipase D family protein n=1 Tax=Alkalibacterium putridalgicola TaxID=426703 RepID=UPI0034CEAA24